MMKKLKLFQVKKVFNIFQIACYEVIHANYMIAFFNKPVA